MEPVLWEQTVRGLLDSGCEVFYEIGPQKVLAGLRSIPETIRVRMLW